MNKFYPSDIYYNQGENAKKIADFLNSLMVWENDACQLVISPITANVKVKDANAGMTVPVKLSILSTEATPNLITFANFTLTGALTETVAEATITPAVSTTTPVLVNGECTVTITLPPAGEGKTYVADEAITLTISDYTAKDGRKITGGTCVLTVIA